MIGKLDGLETCPDRRCQGQTHDILAERGGKWRIACFHCGTAQWVAAVRGHLSGVPAAQFALPEGRFAGLTLAEVAVLPRGMDYMTWAAKEHPARTVRDACKKHLDGLNAAR